MQANLSQPSSARARLGASHGYRLEGDTAFLNAELAIDARETDGLALQLWACDAPYQGGPLRGIKVAEAALRGVTERLEANAIAQLPPAQRDYAMVLVLAADGQVHDFSNYPARQLFAGPHLHGSVGYRFEEGDVVLQASVRNPRLVTNLSGTLALELWALPERYEGGALEGTTLAHVELGSLAGQGERLLDLRVARAAAPAGTWQLAMVLREWTEAGYQTRDFCSFPVPYQVEPAVRVVSAPVPVQDTPAPQEAPAAQVAPVVEPAPVVQQAPAAKAAPEPAREPAPVAKPVRAAPAKAAAKLALKSLEASDAKAAPEPGRVSLSKSSAAELAAVPGMNLKLAQAIVRARPFHSLDELTRVRGIGDKLLQKLRAQLTL
jgi:DNA uptake protein ComE-like DNA-binding protein